MFLVTDTTWLLFLETNILLCSKIKPHVFSRNCVENMRIKDLNQMYFTKVDTYTSYLFVAFEPWMKGILNILVL